MNFLVVDDHPIVRYGVRQLVASHWPTARIDEAATLAEALERLQAQRPDLIVLDLGLPDVSGTEGVAAVLKVAQPIPVLVLSVHEEVAYAARLLKMGASGYLPKDRASDELVTAIERLLEGRRFVTATMAEHLMGMLEGKAANTLPHELLSSQEYRVMLQIADGKSPAEISATMELSVKTIGTYRARILEKTGWRNNNELTKYCVEHKLTTAT
ncbi:MAG: LuxR family transcriptional regulator [Rhizobacter sp.]|jgi:two-component system invasion response regulator UvrY|nr:LuxR family transcriptional regulator [Rhizobacter sp.]